LQVQSSCVCCRSRAGEYLLQVQSNCVCCRSRAVVSAADLEQMRMLQVSGRRVFFSFRAGLSSGGLEPVCLHVGVRGASVCVCCRSRAGVYAAGLEQVCLLQV
jgi:hypothetical protein